MVLTYDCCIINDLIKAMIIKLALINLIHACVTKMFNFKN